MGKNQKRRGPLQALQFSVIGVTNAVVDIGALNLLLFLFPSEERMTLTLFNTIAYALAVTNSYIWNVFITFRDSAKGSTRQRLVFIIQGLISLGINNAVFLGFNALFQALGVPTWIRQNLAKGLAMLASFTASFFMMKYFVFKDFNRRYPNREQSSREENQ
ncbi:GtrA family protein [Marinococcus halotolerans]|uniref:GtrA family protein n=1 Tax=Marinococcus halotolerans TaxID=301092 RepID=UPI0003B343AA|nr:GtrA family protein [Marinococcus halotolerans]